MKKYKVTWGWQPPQYDNPGGNFRLFYHEEKVTREVSHKDPETGEVETETITEWICDVVEYDKQEAKTVLRLQKENPKGIEFHKWMLNARIEAYDNSHYVNEFTINGTPTWLDKATRVGLKLRFEAEIQLNKTETTLWNGNTPITLPLSDAMNMLYAIEIYASACYDITQSHLSQADKLTDVESIKSYDYKSNYPSKLSF